MDFGQRVIQKELFSKGELSELFRVSYGYLDGGPRSSTRDVGELVFTDKAVCFVLHRKYKYSNIWSYPVQLLYVILTVMGAGLFAPAFGVVGGIVGGAAGALLAYVSHILMRRRSEGSARVGIEEMIQRREKKALEDVVAFTWREGITNIEFRGDRIVLSWKDPSRPISGIEFRLLGTLDPDLQKQIRSYVSEVYAG